MRIEILSGDTNRFLRCDNFGIQIHRRRYQFDLGVRLERLLIVRLDRDGVHFDVLVIQAPRGLHVELHLYLPLIIPDRNTQAFDIMSDRHRQIDSTPLAAAVRRPAALNLRFRTARLKQKLYRLSSWICLSFSSKAERSRSGTWFGPSESA